MLTILISFCEMKGMVRHVPEEDEEEEVSVQEWHSNYVCVLRLHTTMYSTYFYPT